MIAIYGVGAKADGSELSLVTIAWNEKVAPMQCMRCMSSPPRCVRPTLLVERIWLCYDLPGVTRELGGETICLMKELGFELGLA